MLPYFIRSENNERLRDSPYHGVGGPMNVIDILPHNPLVDRFFLVSERELEDGVRRYGDAGIRAEGAAAAPLAVALREELPRPVVLIVTGRNIDDALYQRILTSEP